MRTLIITIFVVSVIGGLAIDLSAAEIIAADQPGDSDTAKLQNAIDAAQPGDTIYIGNCTREGPSGEVRCHTPRIWTIDGPTINQPGLVGKNGVEYRGSTETGAKSTLRLVSFSPGEDWDGMRWRDILSFDGQPPSEIPTIIRDVIFDGNRESQGARPNPGCAQACEPGRQCINGWCVSATCDGCTDPLDCPRNAVCNPEPKQEGLLLSASGAQSFEVDGCEFRDHLWVGLAVWHNADVVAAGVRTKNNHNAIQLGGHEGLVTLGLDGWHSLGDRVAFRGEIEGALEAGKDIVRGEIRKSEIVNPTEVAVLFSAKGCDGFGSELVIDGLTTHCGQSASCGAYAHLVPRFASIDIRNSRIGSGRVPGGEGLSIWLQQVSGDVSVTDSKLGGYVHFHSVGPGFDAELDNVLFRNVVLSGKGRAADNFRLPGSPSIDYAFYLNRNLIRANARLLTLEKVDVRAMAAKALLHLYGGIASVDHATFAGNGLPISLGGNPALYSSTLHLERQIGQWETIEPPQGFRLVR